MKSYPKERVEYPNRYYVYIVGTSCQVLQYSKKCEYVSRVMAECPDRETAHRIAKSLSR
jgi:hypothetical protein